MKETLRTNNTDNFLAHMGTMIALLQKDDVNEWLHTEIISKNRKNKIIPELLAHCLDEIYKAINK